MIALYTSVAAEAAALSGNSTDTVRPVVPDVTTPAGNAVALSDFEYANSALLTLVWPESLLACEAKVIVAVITYAMILLSYNKTAPPEGMPKLTPTGKAVCVKHLLCFVSIRLYH